MNYADEALFGSIREAEILRKRTKKNRTVQVAGSECDIIRATTLAWFNNHRPKVRAVFSDSELSPVDDLYKKVMEASHKKSSRSKYLERLKSIKATLISLRAENVIRLSVAPVSSMSTTDNPLDFSPLVQDAKMKSILERRWIECVACIAADAPLAATVMMGGLLEGLLLARINSTPNKASIFTAAAAPKDKQGKTLLLKEWTLQNYIDVAHELQWITVTAKEIGEVLRDFRNYIHPHKEFSHGVALNKGDAMLLWEVSKSISRQVVK